MIAGVHINPKGFLGTTVAIILKEGGAFTLFISEVTKTAFNGLDNEGEELTVSLEDIQSIMVLKGGY